MSCCTSEWCSVVSCCTSEWHPWINGYEYSYTGLVISQDEAVSFCQDLGGGSELAVLHDREEMDFVQTEMHRQKRVHFLVHTDDTNTGDFFRWATGTRQCVNRNMWRDWDAPDVCWSLLSSKSYTTLHY